MAAADGEQRLQMLKDFDETKAGVKGLTDSGLHKLPKIFVRPPEELAKEAGEEISQVQVPVIDLSNINSEAARKQIVEDVRSASETWGFFQVVNHGIPLSVLEGMIDGIRGFHEQDVEEKKNYYTRDLTKSVRYNSSYDLYTARAASWRDTLTLSFNHGSNFLNPHELPAICRDSVVEYSKQVEILGNILFELLSEALGVEPKRLENMECSKGHRLVCHYYPACPEPHLAIGTSKHSDPGFLTILLQSQHVSSLQVLHEGQWIDIQPVLGGLVINIGDLLQLVSNGIYRSNIHRAIANRDGPRISVACFFSGPLDNRSKGYRPIEELITKENPAVYRDIILSEYMTKFFTSPLDNYRVLDSYKISMNECDDE